MQTIIHVIEVNLKLCSTHFTAQQWFCRVQSKKAISSPISLIPNWLQHSAPSIFLQYLSMFKSIFLFFNCLRIVLHIKKPSKDVPGTPHNVYTFPLPLPSYVSIANLLS